MTFVSLSSKRLEHEIKWNRIKQTNRKNKTSDKVCIKADLIRFFAADIYCLNDRSPARKHPESYNFQKRRRAIVH